jgi:ABC-type lipoprotein release transport system permease subunit
VEAEAVVAGLAKEVGVALASPNLLVRTWYEVDPGTADLFRIQAISLVIFVGLFMAVAATGVVNTLLMSVYERTRELGVLRALGVRPRMLVALIFTESVLIGVLGVIGGVVAGLGMDAYTVLHGVDLSVKGGGMSAANVQLDPILYARLTVRSVMLPVVEVLVFSMIAAIWPAWRVARLQPIDAIRDL